MTGRPYAGARDLFAIQRAVSTWDTASCRTLHPGDVAHHLYNALRDYDTAEVARVWERDGELAARALVFPQWQAWEAMVDPAQQAVLGDVLDWCESTVVATGDPSPDAVQTDVSECDGGRAQALEARGYRRGEQLYWATGRPTAGVPDRRLPAGFTFRTASGVEEAEALAEVHAGAFGSVWTGETYRRYMESPAYDPERELVVVAPDGRLAAFSICWLDHHNRVGLLEPVGTHRDFHRRGIGLALVCEGTRRMRDWGMEEATVLHDFDNAASTALYRAAGFKPRHAIWDYRLALA